MSKTLLKNKAFLSIATGILIFLSFEKFNVIPLIFFFPIGLNLLISKCRNWKQGFLYGFILSFIVMLGGFYWVVYVIHEFGYLPWSISTLLYLCFCGFGALNFPVFVALATQIQKKNAVVQVLGLPALFTVVEFFIPKLFPWYVGHCLYKQLWLIQFPEITGSSILTFSIYCLGSTLGAVFLGNNRISKAYLALPLLLWSIQIGFGAYRLRNLPPTSKTLNVGMVQANIGSLEKVQSEKGIKERVKYVVEKHQHLTDSLLHGQIKPDLILWPETSMPFQLDGNSEYAKIVRHLALQWNVPMIIGAYSQSPKVFWRDYNTAFFLLPKKDGTLAIDTYFKNVLLMFGEYLPLGEQFPKLYKYFPQIGGFEVGTLQNAFTLPDGLRLGVTICYEAIIPRFYRKTVSNRVHAVINLTNDSWFGPTSEPYLHGSLTIFRAIESRVPLFRVTNTGLSYAVDITGRMSETTGVYEPGTLLTSIPIPDEPPRTFYIRSGDWLIGLFLILLFYLFYKDRKETHVPISV